MQMLTTKTIKLAERKVFFKNLKKFFKADAKNGLLATVWDLEHAYLNFYGCCHSSIFEKLEEASPKVINKLFSKVHKGDLIWLLQMASPYQLSKMSDKTLGQIQDLFKEGKYFYNKLKQAKLVKQERILFNQQPVNLPIALNK